MKWMRVGFVLAAACIVMVTAGCRESVDAFIGSDFPFTIWGFMNAGADTQYVRVYDISDRIIADRGAEIDARVFSTDLTTGERRQWAYKSVRFDSASSGDVFWSPFRAEHLHRYLLEVIRSDGAMTSAEVLVPAEIEVAIDLNQSQIAFPVRITGDAPNLVGPKITYEAINIPPTNVWPPGSVIHPPVLYPVTISYDDALTRERDGWNFTVNIIRDTTAVRSEFRAACLITPPDGSAPNIWVRNIDFTAVVADSSWDPPGGVFDPDVLAVPGTMSNVQNGYGFFGAGQGIHFQWRPSVEALQLAGYSFAGRCGSPPGPQPTPQCMNPPIPCIDENVDDIWQLWLR